MVNKQKCRLVELIVIGSSCAGEMAGAADWRPHPPAHMQKTDRKLRKEEKMGKCRAVVERQSWTFTSKLRDRQHHMLKKLKFSQPSILPLHTLVFRQHSRCIHPSIHPSIHPHFQCDLMGQQTFSTSLRSFHTFLLSTFYLRISTSRK